MLRFLIFLLFECSEYLVWHRCADNISTNGSPDYFHRFSSNEIRAYKIEQEYLSAVQDPEPLLVLMEPLSICRLHTFYLRAVPAPERKGIVIGERFGHWPRLIVDTNDFEAV